jgi:hypothetical protein
MARLPAKSNSRGIQKRHTRKIKTRDGVREIIVNQGVKKPVPPSQARKVTTRTPPPRNPMKDFRVGLRDAGTSLKDVGQDRRLMPKMRWKDVLKPQKGPTALEVAAQKRKGLEEVYKGLGKNEFLMMDFTIHTESMMSTMGQFIGTDYNGRKIQFPINHQSSNGGLLDYIYEQRELGNPIVVMIGDDGFVGNFVVGARPAEKIHPSDFIPYREEMLSIKYAPTKQYPDRVAVSKGFLELDIDSVRYFKSMADYRQTEDELAKKGLNIFMEPITPQKKISDFKKKGGKR